MGKKILVLSDNHGNLTNLKYILEAFQGEYDVLVHCGDSEFEREMVAALTDRPVYLAEGNCDYDFSGDGEEIFELAEHICFVTHGHRYGVNWGEEELLERAQEMGADIVFYGHTHCPACQYYEEENIWIFNPGSIALPRKIPREPTFLIVELSEEGKVIPKFYSI